jgi:hypothetical protein
MQNTDKSKADGQANRKQALLSRFIHIDAALRGNGGHYADYACEVLKAAWDRGHDPVLVICADQNPPQGLTFPYLRLLSRSLDANAAAAGGAHELPWFRVRVRALQRVEKTIGRNRAMRLSRRSRRLLAMAAAPFVTPRALWGRSRHQAEREAVADLEADLKRLLAGFDPPLGGDDLVFFPSATAIDITAAIRAAAPLSPGPRWAFVLRRDPDHEQLEPRSVLKLRQRRLRRACARLPASVRLFADTALLAERYAALLGQPVHVAPIPVVGAEASDTAGLSIGHLGDARAEKGFPMLPDIIAQAPPAMAFHIQANPNGVNDPDVECARERLAGLSGVRMIEGPLDTGAYRASLQQVDAVLLPYDRLAYARRSSGVFAEAFASAKPALVSQGTWMAGVLQTYEQAWLAQALAPQHAHRRILAVVEAPPGVSGLVKLSAGAYDRAGWSAVRVAAPRLIFVLPDTVDPESLAVSAGGRRAPQAKIGLGSLAADRPVSAAGIICDGDAQSFTAGLVELQRFVGHYRRTCADAAPHWRALHSGRSLVDTVLRSDPPPPRPAL